MTDLLESRGVFDVSLLGPVRRDDDVADVEDGGYYAEQVELLRSREADDIEGVLRSQK